MIFNAEHAFVHPSEFHRAEVYVPEPVVDFFETDILTRERVGDANPVLLSPDAAVATDQADFEVAGVFRGRERGRQRSA